MRSKKSMNILTPTKLLQYQMMACNKFRLIPLNLQTQVNSEIWVFYNLEL